MSSSALAVPCPTVSTVAGSVRAGGRPPGILRAMPSLLATLLVFVSSAAVLVLEILAGRLLAPYVGVTLETFTGIIGTILAGIALGSWWGGRLADASDPRGLLGPQLVIGGTAAFLSIPFVDFLGRGLQGASPSVIVVLAFVGFFVPATVLSMVTPTVVKLQLDSLAETGRVVGRLSAIGTAGALFGTFITGFVLVAAVPTRPVIRLVAGALVLGGLAVWAWLRSARAVSTATVVVAVLAGALSFAAAHPCERESAYFCAYVEDDASRDGGRLLWLDTLRHSYVDLDDPTHLEFTYARTLSDVTAAIAPAGERLDVAHIGGGGFTLPRYLRATRPGTRSVVLELDPALVSIAEEELGLELGDDIEVRTGDARLTLAGLPEDAFDLVLGDAFGGVSVPWHLTTREFVSSIRERLRPGGVYALNLIDFGPRDFARAEAATLADVFAHVAVLAPPERFADDGSGGNFVLVASDEPLPIEAVLERNAARGDDEVAVTTADGSLERFIGGAQVLTDDHAPVDQLLTPSPGRS
ncbi:MAG: fused MFS/spermidine synthase [Actinobacteria bacterium]|nr:fused MFS/spermidine synthase [Actinomycetota bacterium]